LGKEGIIISYGGSGCMPGRKSERRYLVRIEGRGYSKLHSKKNRFANEKRGGYESSLQRIPRIRIDGRGYQRRRSEIGGRRYSLG